MYLYYLIFILVLHNELNFTQQLDKPKTKEIVHKAKCKNIKCPPIEDPVCVKIKNEKNNNIAFIVAINKCEIQYAKCRQGFDAVIVPMNNCQHDLGNSRKTNSKRNKRETQDKQPDYAVFISKNGSTENLSKDRIPNFAVFLGKNDENANDEVAKLVDDEKYNSTAKLNQNGEKMSNEANIEVVEEDNEGAVEEDDEEPVEEDNVEAAHEDNEEAAQEDNEEAAEDDNEKIVEDKNENGDEEDEVDYEQEDEKYHGNSDVEDDKVLNKNDVTDDEGDAKDKEQSHDNESHDRENESERSKDIRLAPDYDQITQDVDYNQNEKDCPSVCAARAVMVCAKCQHNIYRTFMSSCHLRQFNCKYPDENLELISRQPCMQSAPYLTNLPVTRGRISEPDDQDHVLKFIHCRDKGQLDDPSCKFER